VTYDWRSVDSERQRWEDRINASFEHIRSPERVCYHADVTVTLDDGAFVSRCDYCPAWSTGRQVPVLPAPFYFRDPDPLRL